jgi:hypothetical protein
MPFLGAYKETLGISQNPEESKQADSDSLERWKSKIKLNINSCNANIKTIE